MSADYDCYLTAARDILGLRLPAHEQYAHWEAATIHGGFRAMHEEFCIVSDFPMRIMVDTEHRPHCEDGPSHEWRDGWRLYHWHGVRVPAEWIEGRATLSADDVLEVDDAEQRAAGLQIIGWDKVAEQLGVQVLDGDPDTDIGALVEMRMPGLEGAGRFLQAMCPRNGRIMQGVPRRSEIDGKNIDTAAAAQAWIAGLPAEAYEHPPIRT